MKANGNPGKSLDKKKSAFGYFTEIVGWLQIVASPFLIGFIIGLIIYFSKPDKTTLIIGVGVTAIGLVIGVLWANRVWKKQGTIHFISRINATPELDIHTEDKKG